MESVSAQVPMQFRESRSPELSAPSSPVVFIQGKSHFDHLPAGFEQATEVSDREVRPLLCSPEKKAFLQWATDCFEYILQQEPDASPERLLSIVESHYRSHHPEITVPPLTREQVSDLIDALIGQAEKHGLKTWVNGHDSLSSFKESLIDSEDEVPDKQLHLSRFQSKSHNKKCRLTLNVLPSRVVEVVCLLTELMGQPEWENIIHSFKLQKLKHLGKLTDTLIIYLAFDREACNELIRKLADSIPQEVRVEHTPFGMERRSCGISYCESVITVKDDGSFGYSRGRLIVKAIEKCLKNQSIDFHRELENQLFMAGYAPENPARAAEMGKTLEGLT
ncbi:T3SS effector HopA1 family protein [Endozoicomonas arenosclerae]|uniref:T3SS effector HopA1 family protein n=1 Tax=Endozoicomonas arenosclerae TaxID=1633495 RepID=UPI0007831C41|nr:T3SS effector HopA1 family protein [Endozoicomonas arenosclerae]